ncbi:MAG: anaerobic sulfatase maturase [Bacteroidales bacterium]
MAGDLNDFQIFIKPVGARCNLRCRYCYYLDKGNETMLKKTAVMPDYVLEKYIISHIEATQGQEVFFSWHGGEPLLAGIDFYRKAIKFQEKHKPSGYKIYNGIQTNGVILNEEWGRFLSANNFYAGISIDGTEELHNIFRIYAGGMPTFKKALEGYRLLQKYNIRNEILCVVNAVNVSKPLEIYRFFKGLGTQFITFLPLVIRDPSMPEMVDESSVPPEAFGHFLCTVFDEWMERDIGKIKIQIFEEAIRPAFGQEHTLCIFKKTCGRVPVVEINGDFYSCDHFVDREHLIGNIKDNRLIDLLDSEKQKAFGLAKLNTLPQYCLNCDVIEMCNGECPKNRFVKTPQGEPGLNYLCPGYRIFFRYVKPFVDAVGAEWRRRNG